MGKTSPSLFNSAIIEAQQVIKPSCFSVGLIFRCWTSMMTFFMFLVRYLYFNKITTHLQRHRSRSNFPSTNLKQNFFSSMVQKINFQLTSALKLATLWLSFVSPLCILAFLFLLHWRTNAQHWQTTSVPVYERLTDYLLPISIVSTVLSLPGYKMLLLHPICLLWFPSGKYSQLPKRKPFAAHFIDMLSFSCVSLCGIAMATSLGHIRSATRHGRVADLEKWSNKNGWA